MEQPADVAALLRAAETQPVHLTLLDTLVADYLYYYGVLDDPQREPAGTETPAYPHATARATVSVQCNILLGSALNNLAADKRLPKLGWR